MLDTLTIQKPQIKSGILDMIKQLAVFDIDALKESLPEDATYCSYSIEMFLGLVQELKKFYSAYGDTDLRVEMGHCMSCHRPGSEKLYALVGKHSRIGVYFFAQWDNEKFIALGNCKNAAFGKDNRGCRLVCYLTENAQKQPYWKLYSLNFKSDPHVIPAPPRTPSGFGKGPASQDS
jgi:hypothetical protein